jgi:hypothetical protein
MEAIDDAKLQLDATVAQLEQYWHVAPPNAAEAGASEVRNITINDVGALSVLAGAIATQARYLLTTNQEVFPNGLGWKAIAFWHPDTFLTAFFETCPDAYEDVCLDLADLGNLPNLLPT